MFKQAARQSVYLTTILLLMALQVVAAQTLEIDGVIFRDPTQPPGAVFSPAEVESYQEAPRISLNNFTLSFVRSGGINPVAVINNQSVTEGDDINGATVAKIQAGAVVLLIDGQEQILNLYRQSVRQSLTETTVEN